MLIGEHLEPLSKTISIIVSKEHCFNTDTLLLAAFSMPKRGEKCMDLGTGCGAIPLIWLSKSRPASVFAVELQKNAADMAARSTILNSIGSVLSVLNLDLRELKNYSKKHPELQNLDLVSCNPPYQAQGAGLPNKNESQHLARHEEACTLKEIALAAASVLRFGGRFCLCQRPERLCDVLEQMRSVGIEPKRLRFVQQRTEKAPKLFLVQGRKGAKQGLIVDPVLLVEDDHGFSHEMLELYGEYKEAAK